MKTKNNLHGVKKEEDLPLGIPLEPRRTTGEDYLQRMMPVWYGYSAPADIQNEKLE